MRLLRLAQARMAQWMSSLRRRRMVQCLGTTDVVREWYLRSVKGELAEFALRFSIRALFTDYIIPHNH